jgi:phosphoribosylanthranilate isomerase
MKPFPRLKFCGFTREIDVEHAIQAGASAIGLNFVPKSKRYVDSITAVRLSQIAKGQIQCVGVFANSTVAHVAQLVQSIGLDAVQLHGAEGLEWLASARTHEGLAGIPLIRSLPYRGNLDDPAIAQWCREANDPQSVLCAILVDAYDSALLGGTGKTVRWDLLYPRPKAFFASKLNELAPFENEALGAAPLILAGGIDRHNVSQACRRARPDGIDLASGIETEPGIKDRDAMFAVAELVHAYFAQGHSDKS